MKRTNLVVISLAVLLLLGLVVFALNKKEVTEAEKWENATTMNLTSTIEYVEYCMKYSSMTNDEKMQINSNYTLDLLNWFCNNSAYYQLPSDESLENLKKIDGKKVILLYPLSYDQNNNYSTRGCIEILNASFNTMGARPHSLSYNLYRCSGEYYLWTWLKGNGPDMPSVQLINWEED